MLIGCSSIRSQDPTDGAAVYQQLQRYLTSPALRTHPRSEFVVAGVGDPGLSQRAVTHGPGSSIPVTADASARLLRAYLAIGARICGPPAIDREFGTIDFLTLLDLHGLPAIVRAHFLR